MEKFFCAVPVSESGIQNTIIVMNWKRKVKFLLTLPAGYGILTGVKIITKNI